MSEILVKALFIGEIVVIVNYLCRSDDPHTHTHTGVAMVAIVVIIGKVLGNS